MAIHTTDAKILLSDKNGSKLFVTYLSLLASILLSVLLVVVQEDRIAFFAVWLMFTSFTIWMICTGYYQIDTVIDKTSQKISIRKKRLGRKFSPSETIAFKDVGKVLYLYQLSDYQGRGRWSAILYLEVRENRERIKIYSQPSRKTYGHKDTVGPLESEGRALAEFIGADFEILEVMQPLDS